jgi:hypothetical protein
MGRTLPPFSQLIESERRAWALFRRALRKADQGAFDRLFDCAKRHVQAGVYVARPWPFEVIAMAMLLEHHKWLEQLLAQLEAFRQSTPPSTALAREASSDPPALTDQIAWSPVSSPTLFPTGAAEQARMEDQCPKDLDACPLTRGHAGEGTHSLPQGSA